MPQDLGVICGGIEALRLQAIAGGGGSLYMAPACACGRISTYQRTVSGVCKLRAGFGIARLQAL